MLSQLENLYSNVRNYQLVAETSQQGDLKFKYKTATGCTDCEKYGIRLAQSMGFPPTIIDDSIELYNRLVFHEQKDTRESEETRQQRIHLQLFDKLVALKSSSLDDKTLLSYLQKLKAQYADD